MTVGMRALEDQFDGQKAARIRQAASRASGLTLPDGVSRYYRSELVFLLEAGALFGALHLAASLLEITVRGVIVERARRASPGASDLESALEDKRDLSFSSMVNALRDVGLFDPQDATIAASFYRDVRIPVFHGLASRFVTVHGDAAVVDFMKLIRAGEPTSSHEFEIMIEDQALDHVELVINLLNRNVA